MRSILVNADRRPGMDARLESALALARVNNGHVTLVVDTPVARYVAMDPMGGSYVASDALKQAIADDDAFAASLEGRLSREDVPFDVVRSEAEPTEALAKAARLADVVVVSRSGGLAGDLALTTRTPVLALTDSGVLSAPLASACIAWDGGDEAACALRASVPLLAGCQSIHVITVAEKAGGFPPTEALRYLSRHGLKAELVELPRRGSIEETLDVAVTQHGADLLVMGAFGHSRLRQFLFGGVTRFFLDKQTGPALLLAH
jgi:nucleotide-binding universal stress UspA family protein